jgi:hypothetical protein
LLHKLIVERLHLFEPNAHICLAVEFSEVFAVDVLQEALQKVTIQHPLMHAQVHLADNGDAYYQIDANVEPQLQVEALTRDTEWLSIVAREQKKPFAWDRGPLIRFTCLHSEGRMQLLICFHHVLADGLSGITILKDLLFFLHHPDQAAQTGNIRLMEDSPLYEGEKLPFLPGFLVNRLNRQWRKSPLLFTKEEYDSLHNHYWQHRSHTLGVTELSSLQLDKLAAKCHHYQVTINSLLLASLLKCAYDQDKRNKKAALAVSLHSDEKRFGNHASGISIQYGYNSRKSIWENAAAVQTLIRRKRNNPQLKHFFLTFLKALDGGLIDSMYVGLFGATSRKPTASLQRWLGYTHTPLGLAATNLGRTGLTVKDGIRSAFFIPPLVANTDKIVGIASTDSGLRAVYQYSNQINTRENKQIFSIWAAMLQELSA